MRQILEHARLKAELSLSPEDKEERRKQAEYKEWQKQVLSDKLDPEYVKSLVSRKPGIANG